LGLGILMKRREMDSIKSNSPSYFRQSSRRGQTLVEFAIILPLLLLIIFGVIDLGRAFYTSVVLSNAAREGARFAALNYGDAAVSPIEDAIRIAALAEADGSGISGITISLPSGIQSQGLSFVVRAEHNFGSQMRTEW
jgi:Flp pilus assembly protein TadG